VNHIYRLVWSQVRRTWLVVSELARGRGKTGRALTQRRTRRSVWWAAIPLGVPMLALAAAPAGITAIDTVRPAAAIVAVHPALAPTVIAPVASSAHPTGGQVTAGSGRIDYGDHLTTIQQDSQNLSLNWLSFNIGAQDTVNFLQPNAQSIAVNRIADPNGSVILGHLNANGQVFLLNPNGVLFGQGAQVNVGGLVASTLDVSDSELGRGTLHFGGAGGGSVTNRGTLTAAPGGYVALLGHSVSNQGAIHAPAGSVALAGGSAVTLSFDGNHLLNMQIDASTLNALAENRQLIVADGGQVLMSAGAKDSLLASVVNNTGTIQAQTVENRAGKIVLLGGIAAGTTQVAGTLDASAPNGGDGGFIETSAAQVQVADGAKIFSLAAAGNAGTWLIDPQDFTIAASGGDITGAALGAALGSGNVTIESANGGASGSGDIRVDDSVSWGGNILTLSAYNDIHISRPLNASGAAGLALAYGQGAVAAGNTATYHVNAPVNLSADGSFSTRLGSDGTAVDYTIITGLGDINNPSPADLLMLSVSYNGYFVLGADIDASATASWVGGAGFEPVPDFMGTFDGLGHTITGLTINRPDKNAVGLFGLTEDSAIVRNVGMVGGAITGNGSVGSLVGSNYGTITHAYATGAVTNVAPPSTLGAAGGLVGSNNGSITNAYATGAVTSGGYAVGGLVGLNLGTITSAYATGTVSSGSFGASGGGLVGVNGGTITNAYWDTDTATQATTAGVTGLTTQQLIASLPTGFDPAIWGNSDNQTTPYMLGRTGNQVFTRNDLPSITGANLYTVILDLDHLQAIQANLGDRYVLGNAIDASDTSGLNGGGGFVPLGTDGAGNVLNGGGGFTGTFDGLGYAITGLSIHRANHVGLFGYAGNGSILRNLSLLGGVMAGSDYVGGLVGQNIGGTITHVYTTNAVTGSNYVGGLVGSSQGTITDAHATGAVTGDYFVGGLLGQDIGGTIIGAYATGAVTGNRYVGGLVGEDDGGTITNVYATNVVSGSYFVGGLIGSDNSTITDAYATGAVTGSDYVGGLVGKDDGGTITNVHATGAVIGTNNYVGGLVGLNNSTIDNAYATGAVTGNDRVGGLVGSNNSTITHAHTTGTVNGNSMVGGLVGSNSGTITHAFATGAITGTTHVGGLVGDNTGLVGDNSVPVNDDDEPIIDTYATGVVTGSDYAGGLVGYNRAVVGDSDSGTIARAYATGVVMGGDHAGGLVGQNIGTITHASATGAITGTTHVGGLAGESNGAITDAHATGAVTGDGDYVGGLVGNHDGGTADIVYATGAVTGGNYVGGLMGRNDATITNAYATGAATGDTYVGGLMGSNSGAISYAYATGAATGGDYVGGLVGSNDGAISYAYATGAVTAETRGGIPAGYRVGGLVGYNDNQNDNIHYSYWDTETTGQGRAIGALGSGSYYSFDVTSVTTTAMMQASTFAGWDMDSTGGGANAWRIYDGHTFPLLKAFLTQLTVAFDPYVVITTYNGQAFHGVGLIHPLTDADMNRLWFSSDDGSPVRNAGSYDLSGEDLYSDQQGYDIVVSGGGSGFLYINRASLTLAAVTDSRAYDSTTTSSGTATVTGLLGSDAVTNLSQDFASKNVLGTNGSTLAVNSGYAIDDGNGGNNYMVNFATATGTITPVTLTLGGLSADDKVYDATTTATATGSVSGVLGSDDVNAALAASFADKNVGTGKTVTVDGITLGGTDGGNYVIAAGQTATADITPATLTLGNLSADDKVYDTTTAATAIGSLFGVFGSDDVNAALAASFADKNAGTAKTVTVDGITLGGTDAGNYLIADGQTTTADITPATLTLVGLFADDKVYDATTAATATGSLSGVLGSDDVDAALAASFADKNAGTAKTVTVVGTLSGTDGGNYVIADNQTTTADISKRTITVGATGTDRAYDGTTIDSVSLASAGLLGSDVVDFSGTGNFSDKNVGTGKAVAVTGIAASGTDADNYSFNTTANTTADISRLGITVDATGSNKIYDGSTADTVALASAGVLTGDTVNFTGSGGFTDKHVGTGKTVSVSGIAASGGDANNYSFNVTASTTADITAKTITVDATGANKVYDGSTVDAVALASAGVLSGDTVNFTGIGSFADKHVGTAKVVGVSGIAASGSDAGNYSFNATAATTADITAKAITVDAAGVDKIYDGSTDAAASLAGAGVIAGDDIAFGGSASFADKHAGIGKIVTVNGIAASGADAGNYSFNTSANTTADIAAKTITVDATGADKVYDSTTSATIAALGTTGLVAGDAVTFDNASAAFDNKNVGTGKTVTISGIAATGADAGNYSFNTTANTTADISQLGITVDATGTNKVYDGSTADAVALASAGVLSGDTVNFTGTGSFADKHVGTAKAVGVSGIAASGSDANNYSFNTAATTTADITAKTITVDATGVDKVYDGSTAATITALGTTGLVAGDVVTFGNASAAFDNKNAGTGKTVTVRGIAASGTDADNYSFNTTTNTTADISQLGITVDATGNNKIYDGGTVDTVALASAGVLSGDTVSFTGTGSFADKNAGTGKTVSVTGIAASGSDANNYSFNATAATTADITAKTITVDATGTNKIYDGSTADTVALASAGVLTGDTVNFTGIGSFTDKHVGTGKTVSVSGIAASGSDANNYSFNTTAATTADVTAKTITVDATGVDKVYDGGTSATIVALGTTGLVAGDAVTFDNASAAFDNKNVGTGKTVTVSGIAASGTDAGNYSFNTAANTTADISQLGITVDATGMNKVYDGSTVDAVALASAGVLSGDTVNFSGTGSFTDKNVGIAKAVDVSGIAASGADAANYSFNITANTTADITTKTITVGATGVDKVYNGSTAATITALGTTGLVAGDVVTFSNASVAFDDKNAGTDKAITINGITATGADAGNYSFGTTANTTANISLLGITVDATGSNKVYDGSTADAVTLASTGVLSADTVNFAGNGSFADKNAGTGKTVNVSGITASGIDAGNYSFNTTANTTANISQLGITVDATGSNKVYDGTTADAVALASAGVLSGDTVNFTGSGSFADKNAGTSKTVTVNGITASGSDANNYGFNATATTTADVTPATLTYRADTAHFQAGQMPGDLSGAVTGLVGGDTLADATEGALTWQTPATASSPAGLYAIDGSGLSALNYLFEQAPENATALQVINGSASRVVTTIVAGLQQDETSPDDDVHTLHAPSVHIVDGGVRLP
jgi:filamentous hemagglutinin family protein